MADHLKTPRCAAVKNCMTDLERVRVTDAEKLRVTGAACRMRQP